VERPNGFGREGVSEVRRGRVCVCLCLGGEACVCWLGMAGNGLFVFGVRAWRGSVVLSNGRRRGGASPAWSRCGCEWFVNGCCGVVVWCGVMCAVRVNRICGLCS
jgi:hypothetical protein